LRRDHLVLADGLEREDGRSRFGDLKEQACDL